MEDKKKFTYIYSSAENNEIKQIREKYAGENESKVEQLRKLDKSVNDAAAAASLVTGIIGMLILGFGLSCVLVWNDSMFIPGIVIGIIGIIILSFAYPAYRVVATVRRKKIAPMIIKLADEIMKQ